MATVYFSPKDAIVDFLRAQLTDPQSRAETAGSDSFSISGATTEFQLTPPSGKVNAVTSVTLDGSPKSKWSDYYLDIPNQKIIFFNSISSGTLVVNFKYGPSSWIYPDKPMVNLSVASFPRIHVSTIAAVGSRLGQYNAPVETVLRVEVGVHVKETKNSNLFTINSIKYSGQQLAEYLAHKVTEAFENNEDDLHPMLYGYNPVKMPTDIDFDVDRQEHLNTVEFEIRVMDSGRFTA